MHVVCLMSTMFLHVLQVPPSSPATDTWHPGSTCCWTLQLARTATTRETPSSERHSCCTAVIRMLHVLPRMTAGPSRAGNAADSNGCVLQPLLRVWMH